MAVNTKKNAALLQKDRWVIKISLWILVGVVFVNSIVITPCEVRVFYIYGFSCEFVYEFSHEISFRTMSWIFCKTLFRILLWNRFMDSVLKSRWYFFGILFWILVKGSGIQLDGLWGGWMPGAALNMLQALFGLEQGLHAKCCHLEAFRARCPHGAHMANGIYGAHGAHIQGHIDIGYMI